MSIAPYAVIINSFASPERFCSSSRSIVVRDSRNGISPYCRLPAVTAIGMISRSMERQLSLLAERTSYPD